MCINFYIAQGGHTLRVMHCGGFASHYELLVPMANNPEAAAFVMAGGPRCLWLRRAPPDAHVRAMNGVREHFLGKCWAPVPGRRIIVFL